MYGYLGMVTVTSGGAIICAGSARQPWPPQTDVNSDR